jgi:membrane protein implicated in regulation of membrane protease activity
MGVARMAWQASTLWWLAGGALVAAELASGTFYLLMLAVGTTAAALAAHAGAGVTLQLLAAALVGGGAVALWHLRRERPGARPDAAHDPAINLDIGSTVQVDAWRSDGSSRVQHRGAGWDARFVGTGTPKAGVHVITGVQGSCLLLDHLPA